MKQAGLIASLSMIEAMKATKVGMSEHQLAAIMEYHIKMRGAQRFSYPPVVAGGNNATTLHYINNDMILQDGDLVLMDAGCEFNGYASDITRVWPINGKFNKAQLEIYNLVLEANKMGINLCEASKKMSLSKIHNIITQFLNEGLISLGIKKKGINGIDTFYPHFIGHYLGMDTHDVKDLDCSITLKPGMIITIEPGIYIPYDDNIPSQYQGIGIRIEDNLLITEGEPVILTNHVPKEPYMIENIMSNK
jgi:intermediate cleaving peptidase 55